jgi:transcriptional regulator with XRE-family HTH domain
MGQLVRDRRCAAKLSRVQLARLAQLSDATIKLLETARVAPSRTTLLRLLNVAALRLRWEDLPGPPRPPRALCTGRPRVDVLSRLEFDELGDPVLVRRLVEADAGPDPEGGIAECELIPLRRRGP